MCDDRAIVLVMGDTVRAELTRIIEAIVLVMGDTVRAELTMIIEAIVLAMGGTATAEVMVPTPSSNPYSSTLGPPNISQPLMMTGPCDDSPSCSDDRAM